MTWANCTDVLQFRSGKMPWNRKSTDFLLTHKHLHIQINTKLSHIHPLSKYSHSSASQFILSDTHTHTQSDHPLGASYFLHTADKQEVTTELKHRSHPVARMMIPLHRSFASLWYPPPSSHFLPFNRASLLHPNCVSPLTPFFPPPCFCLLSSSVWTILTFILAT